MLGRWDHLADDLRALLTPSLEGGYPPAPLLLGYQGDEPAALTHLRPFAPAELLTAVIEVVAVYLPLGVDRLVLAAPGRAWHLDDPAAGDVGGLDARPTVVAVTTVAGDGPGPPRVSAAVWPYARADDGRLAWCAVTGTEVATGTDAVTGADQDGPPHGPVPTALATLVAHRHTLPSPDARTAVQFARCALRGHAVVLCPELADRLESFTVAGAR